MRARLLPTAAGRNARRNPHVVQGSAEPVSVVSPAAKQGGGLWDQGQQSPRADVIQCLACRQENPDRAALRIAQNMQL